ncbi:PEP-CTERM sorting domain-containing protein [Calidifontimicrobium sp. SYSU G02091]|uniref:PEP-CTERM sorting domain-containing protein n=1 Tax=Calidifontimicrobium sp. SYSU G02091 TaxID=2926421 RepID=UPI001F53C3BB|nr:PEP-CTERM sorting domain-containing protein [Calidifontimicrobium sp. SYSU G02091]MCI1190539.1 PEP-CTERM sorting domain-containing protein [Calidifontimicrobium sp. SYSU G02091]
MKVRSGIGLAVAGVLWSVSAGAMVVNANAPAPGDAFTNAGPVNQGQAIGTSGWYYNNVRNGGTVGINTALPRSGNGSARFASLDGADKADIEFLPNGLNLGGNFVSAGVLGSFSQLGSMSYEWYRSDSSTTDAHLHPVLRVLLDADGDLTTTGDRGGLVFERVYIEASGWTASTNTWVSETITDSTYLWNFGLGLGFAANINSTDYAYDATLAQWKAYLPNAVIIGFSSGVGSGWNDTFTGAVDNIAWNIAGQGVTYNFEVAAAAVPQPGSLALLAAAMLGWIGARRRRPAV